MARMIDITNALDMSLERSRLVGLCAAITGNADAAEDLAQETLLEAWRHMEDLRNQEKFFHWLSGIARNVCLRWLRQQGRQAAHLIEYHSDAGTSLSELEDWLVDDFYKTLLRQPCCAWGTGCRIPRGCIRGNSHLRHCRSAPAAPIDVWDMLHPDRHTLLDYGAGSSALRSHCHKRAQRFSRRAA